MAETRKRKKDSEKSGSISRDHQHPRRTRRTRSESRKSRHPSPQAKSSASSTPSPSPSTPPSGSGLRFALSRNEDTFTKVMTATSPRFHALPTGSRVEIARDSWKTMRLVGEMMSDSLPLGGGGAGLIVDYGGDRTYGDSFRVRPRSALAEMTQILTVGIQEPPAGRRVRKAWNGRFDGKCRFCLSPRVTRGNQCVLLLSNLSPPSLPF